MRTPKIISFQRLIDWLNYRFNLNIEKLNIDNSFINSNSGLSGFIDADDHFSVCTIINSIYLKIECIFELNQRQLDHNK